MTQLELAKGRFVRNKYESDLDYGKSFRDFIIDCYLNYGPSTYGVYIQKKILMSLKENKIDVESISQKKNRGDFMLNLNFQHVLEISGDDIFPRMSYGLFQSKKHYEFKSSYLGKNGGYTIRNIRPYQDIDGGYLLCFIDCENDFKEEFYLVDYEDIVHIFNLSHMNGVSSQHKKGGFVNYGASFYKDSFEHFQLGLYSKLDGKDLNAVISYFHNMENDFVDRCKSSELYNEDNNCDDKMRSHVQEYYCYQENSDYKECFVNIKNSRDYSLVVSRVIGKLKEKYDRLICSYEDPRAASHQVFVLRGSKDVGKYFEPLFGDYISEFIAESKLLG